MPEFEPLLRKHLKFLQEKEQVLVWGNVARKFESEKALRLAIDDFTAVVNVVAFLEQKEILEGFEVGDRLQVIGSVRKDKNEELYILPEIVIKIDCWTEMLKRLENLQALKGNKGKEERKTENLENGKLEVESNQL